MAMAEKTPTYGDGKGTKSTKTTNRTTPGEPKAQTVTHSWMRNFDQGRLASESCRSPNTRPAARQFFKDGKRFICIKKFHDQRKQIRIGCDELDDVNDIQQKKQTKIGTNTW